jgi:hypothetical protein
MSIKADVDRGLVVHREMAALEKEKSEIDARLIKAALDRPDKHLDLKDAERGGTRWLATGTEQLVPIIFTDDKLIGSFQTNSPVHEILVVAADGNLRHFFKPINAYKNRFDDGKKFRKLAAELLAESAPAFITACTAKGTDGLPKSDIKIQWDAAEAIPEK